MTAERIEGEKKVAQMYNINCRRVIFNHLLDHDNTIDTQLEQLWFHLIKLGNHELSLRISVWKLENLRKHVKSLHDPSIFFFDIQRN